MKHSVRTVVVVVLSLGLLAVFLRGAHLDVVWQEIKQADGWLVVVSMATTVLVMALRAVRWQYLLAPIGTARFGPAFRTTMIGFAMSSVLPARPGEVIRPYLLARQEGLSATSTFATIVVERLLDSVTIVLMLASFVVLFDPGMAKADSTMYRLVRTGGVAVAAGTVFLLGVMFAAARDPQALGRWAYKLEHLLPGRLAHKLADLLRGFAEGLAVVRAPRRLFVALLLSVPVWLFIAVGVWTVVLAFHIEDVPFTGSFLILAMLAVGVSVPTPGGVGGFEAAIQIGLTKFYGVPNDTAVGAALVVHATSLLPTVLLGFLFLIQDGLKLGGMQKLASAAAHGDAP
ncbi:MAG: flippase-like domain-containing protein [Vicinamibacterales bacterium]|nr:flippase-like domain-containing protein [Vicinamibacterales bacterium]